jgi:hypothetical protein
MAKAIVKAKADQKAVDLEMSLKTKKASKTKKLLKKATKKVKKAITLKHKNFKTSSPHRLVKPGAMKKPSTKPVQAKKKAVVN